MGFPRARDLPWRYLSAVALQTRAAKINERFDFERCQALASLVRAICPHCDEIERRRICETRLEFEPVYAIFMRRMDAARDVGVDR